MAWRCSASTNRDLVANLAAASILASPTSAAALAMLAVDRAHFAPRSPYSDSPQSIGYGATISAPHMHAYALEHLSPFLDATQAPRVLDVGSGSGFLTACFAHMIGGRGRVVGIEHVEALAQRAGESIREAGLQDWIDTSRVVLVTGDGRRGYPTEAPYDAIHVGAAAPETPQMLLDQLRAPGCMFIPVGERKGCQAVYKYVKKADGSVSKILLFSVQYVPLTDLDKQVNGES